MPKTDLLSKKIFFLIILFTIIVLYRISTTIPNTLAVDYTSITNIPWADGVSWVTGAENILDGKLMAEFPSRRAIYPAFLSLIFFCTNGTYNAAIFTQSILFSIAIFSCFLLLRDIKEKISVGFFFACITLWLPITQSLFLTENLGAILLIVSFGCLWKGVQQRCSNCYSVGLFLMSLAFFTRPWAIGCLLTLPLLAFLGPTKTYIKLRYFLVYIFAIIAGFLINYIVTSVFSTPGTASNYPQTLYGLVSHSLNWRAASLDPVIAKFLHANTDPLKLNTIIYKRCLEIFMDNPWLFLHSILDTYSFYLNRITSSFNTNIYLYPLFTLLFFVSLRTKAQKPHWLSYLFILAVLLLAYFHLPQFIFLVLLLYGLSHAIIKRHSNIGSFILLYLFGIFISLPIVGIDGGNRVKIASDIFLFFLAAFGLQQLFQPTKENREAGFIHRNTNFLPVLAAFAFSIMIFVCLPWITRLMVEPAVDPAKISPMQVSSQLNMPSLPLSTVELEQINRKWPSPSFETINGTTVLTAIKYTDRDSIFLNTNEGIQQRSFEFWPMGNINPPISRTIHTRSWCIFPLTPPSILKQFDKKNIHILGTLIGKPRKWKYDTGYAIMVTHIGTDLKEGGVAWVSLKNLNKQNYVN